MRVKLSYSVAEEEVLSEAAKILNLATDKMQQAVNLFADIQKELSTSEGAVNINNCLKMINSCRKSLYNVDTRCEEIAAIVGAYDSYYKNKSLRPGVEENKTTSETETWEDADNEAALLGDG